MTYRVFLLAAIGFVTVCFACNKDDERLEPGPEDPPGFKQKLVSKVIDIAEGGDSTVYEFFYSSAELVDSIVTTEPGTRYTKTFFRQLPLIVGSVNAFGTGFWEDSTWLDSGGYPSRTVKRVGPVVIEFRYLYDAGGRLTHTIGMQPGATTADTTLHIWDSDNMVASVLFGLDTVQFHYDNSKTYQRGEQRHLAVLQEIGQNAVPGRNLQTGFTQGGVREDYTFQFSADGHIERISSHSGGGYKLIEYK